MPHPEVVNRTPFSNDLLLLVDQDGRPLVVPLLQATFEIAADGTLDRAEPQPPIQIGGRWWGDPADSSLHLEPQIAWTKPGTDVVLVGHAHAQRSSDTVVSVGIAIGSMRKVVRVIGDRRLYGHSRISAPEPVDRIPLIYERAFGGWDRRHDDPDRHSYEQRNPVGRGFRDPSLHPDDEVLLPNLEDPGQPFRRYGDTPQPAGFGFLMPNWRPRLALAGTFDDVWAKSRAPLLPNDFDVRFFHAASPGLISPTPLRGDERVVVANATPKGRLDFELPGLPPPTCALALRGSRRVEQEMCLDTVVVDTDQSRVTILWRTSLITRDGPHDVTTLEYSVPGMLYRAAPIR